MSETVEFSVGGGLPGLSMDAEGPTEDAVKQSPLGSVSIDADNKDKPDAGDDTDAALPPDATGDVGEQDGDGEEGSDAPLEDLGEFNAEDQEVVAAFDARYRSEDGELNVEALSKEFWANAGKDGDGLNESTYAYLEAAGFSKSVVKQVEAALATKQATEAADVERQTAVSKSDQAILEVAGGQESLNAAIEWGKKGGYTADQKKRFNDALKGADLEARQEAVEVLMARYNKANPPPAPKPKIPARDATKGQGAGRPDVKGFTTEADMRAARDALRPGDTRAHEAYKARLRATKEF